MAYTSTEIVAVTSDRVTVDLLVWRRYRVPANDVVSATLDINPHLAELHRISPFLPVGTQIVIPIDPDRLALRPPPVEARSIFSRRP